MDQMLRRPGNSRKQKTKRTKILFIASLDKKKSLFFFFASSEAFG